jgi:hypothetical protein
MVDALRFKRSIARFTDRDASYLVDLLSEVYLVKPDETLNDLILALDECDCIEIEDDEVVLDEN